MITGQDDYECWMRAWFTVCILIAAAVMLWGEGGWWQR